MAWLSRVTASRKFVNLIHVEDLAATYGRYCDLARRGATIGPDVSMLKIWATETLQRITGVIQSRVKGVQPAS